ncbi:MULTISPECIES: phosphate acetyltransferase [Exiguobacterium]|uniref:Phosphate acetyltransferase n=1 Tax=Exiguobacterium aurantiacum TaxID=33987 RepID=A0ABY5FNS0_9BACL|nr:MULTISPECIES: phosphate acetyltransferase [Exiguobacterium]KGI86572.1 phosphotransacetylase [Exiguobacterium mexicanum]UTT43250.1 phosphate acetyltransferase [Exiguobacterium aurantiacum]
MKLFDTLKQKVSPIRPTIVFPEGVDERVLGAAVRLKNDGMVEPIVIGPKAELEAVAAKHGFDISGLTQYDPATYEDIDTLVESFVERRKGKATPEQARELLSSDVNYFGTMLVHTGKAEGLVSGAMHATADTVRPALQIIKMQTGIKKTSGVFIMVRDDEQYVFSDCAINIAPDAADLAENAYLSALTAKTFGIEPQVALLSFSTKGSAKSPETEKVIEATRLAKEKAPNLPIDGELQFDAAFVPSVAAKKAPGSEVAGNANVFVFPSLEAGNIGYKMVQRFGGFEAIGPILQGLNKPVNDLSRGCNEEDVYKLTLITAAQAIDERNEA